MNNPKIRGYVAEKRNTMVLLFRRTRHCTYLFRWDYSKNADHIVMGSCFHGRIFPNRGDISPDGNYLIYFAMGISKKYGNPGCWTAICHPPTWTAELFLEQRDTWGGGGDFVDDKNIFIAPGAAPHFDVNKKIVFQGYSISYDHSIKQLNQRENQWSSIEFSRHNKLPIRWLKENTRFNLHRKLQTLNKAGGKYLGEYDSFIYQVISPDGKYLAELQYAGVPALWADFDNFSRLVCGCGNKVLVFDRFDQVKTESPVRIFDLDLHVNNRDNPQLA